MSLLVIYSHGETEVKAMIRKLFCADDLFPFVLDRRLLVIISIPDHCIHFYFESNFVLTAVQASYI